MNTTHSAPYGFLKSNGAPTQADRIFAKFGGVPALKKALDRVGGEACRSLSTLYRWNLPRKNGGSAGIVPSSAHMDIMRAARLEGVMLTPEDWAPSV
jgi:hypothetical protein